MFEMGSEGSMLRSVREWICVWVREWQSHAFEIREWKKCGRNVAMSAA